MPVKKTVRKVHLILGLASGLIVVFLGITGCILAFQKEIEHLSQSYRFVQKQEKEFLPPSQLKAIGVAQLPGKHLHSVLYHGKDRSTQVIFFDFEPNEHYYIVYLNPYDGSVLEVKNMYRDFFYQVIQGHYYLWLPPNIGQPIVASATLVFVIMMITGLILWWPRNKAARKQRFSIKWSATWKRKNYDLHNVLGFYMTWVAIIIAFTGLVFGFEWFRNSVYKATGGKKSLVYSEPYSGRGYAIQTGKPMVDILWERMKKEYPNSETLEVHIPTTDSSVIEIAANPDSETYWKIDYRYFDRYSLQELQVGHIYGRSTAATVADKLIRMNYDIHTGAIWGLPGKILAFFASLIASSLPVTGFLIWMGRRKKRKAESRLVYRAEMEPA